METPRIHEDRIRERAYSLWEAEGCPDGCADRHWREAETALLQDDGDQDSPEARNASTAELQAPSRTGDARSRRRV
jgi:hypothetical protein